MFHHSEVLGSGNVIDSEAQSSWYSENQVQDYHHCKCTQKKLPENIMPDIYLKLDAAEGKGSVEMGKTRGTSSLSCK